MELIMDGVLQAFWLLWQRDPGVLEISWLTIKITGSATMVSVIFGIPFGALLALGKLPGRRFVMSLVYTGMGFPPVVAGLVVSIIFWRSGPLGVLGLMYTPAAMIIAQGLIAVPLVAGLTVAALQQLDKKLPLQLKALGASRRQLFWTMLKEARLGLLAAVMAGFGGVVSEVGAASMVGGNILHRTRVLTTATVLEVSRGNFGMAIALSVILMLVAYGLVLVMMLAQQRGREI